MAVISSGTTLIDNGTLDAGVSTGSLILISTQTASASATIDFTSGIDSTYDSYVFKYINIHPSNNVVNFEFNLSTDGGTNYNVTKTTTMFRQYHDEADTLTNLDYTTAYDLAQSTSFQLFSNNLGNLNDECCSGTFQIFNPSSTTFVKHFIARTSVNSEDNFNINYNLAGYGNTTSAVNAIRFRCSAGNIDDGIIKMYGVK